MSSSSLRAWGLGLGLAKMWLHTFGRAGIVVRGACSVDVLIARGRVIFVGVRERRAVSTLHSISAGAFNAGGARIGNWAVRFSFVRRFYGARGHAILRMPTQQVL